MPLGSTNISLSGILTETNAFAGSNDSFIDYNNYSWEQGPPPGDNTANFWGSGVKNGVSDNILYNPSFNGANTGVSNNFKFSFYKNYYGYMDQANYVIDMFIENSLPPASRPNPPNTAVVDMGLQGSNYLGFNIAPLDGTANENGGTYGPVDKSNSNTFNVEYFYATGGVQNQGTSNYTLDIRVNGSNVYYQTGLNGTTPINATNDFSSIPVNNSNGFIVEYYFT